MSLPTKEIENRLNVAEVIVREAGKKLMEGFGTVEKVVSKTDSPGDIVTEYDLAADEILRKGLSESFADDIIKTEESGQSGARASDWQWLCDPIDGTTNFAHAIPFFCTNVGLLYRGEIVGTLTYDPYRDEMFKAQKNMGAYLNDKKIQVTRTKDLARALVFISFSYQFIHHPERYLVPFANLHLRTRGIRKQGSAALDLAWLAAARCDATWNRDLFDWDVLPGSLLVTEAGGMVTDQDGTAWHGQSYMIASNGFFHSELLDAALAPLKLSIFKNLD